MVGAQAQDNSCATPRDAVSTFLGNLQAGEENPSAATRCFDWSETEPGVRATLARRLKAVLDQRGLYIDLDELPATPEIENDEDGRVELTRRLPEVYLVKAASGDWQISAASVGEIEALYADTFSFDVEGVVESFPAWMRVPLLPGISLWQLLGVFFAILLGLLVRFLVVRVVVGQGIRLFVGAGKESLRRVGAPIGTLALGAVLWWVFPLLRFSVRVNQVLGIGIRVMSAASVVLIAYRLVDLGSDLFARRAEDTETKLDDQLVPLIRKALKVFVAAIGIIFVLQNLDVDVGSLIAGASLGGLAFTLAAKDTVANLFGSISIFADQPFQVGDWVIIEGKEGVVEEVGMRSTRIRTFYESVISIPNSVVANAAVDNYGQRRFRRCNITLGLTYATTPDQLQAFVEGIRAILKANKEVRQDVYEVHFRDFGASALEVLAYFFFSVDSWTAELRARQNVFLEILRLADALGVDFAYPTQTLHIEKEGSVVSTSTRKELSKIARDFGPEGDRSNSDSGDIASGFWPTAGE
ncbi:MAG: MscS family membrane protein [Polyangiales bacterium]